jgi:hypothetical protein
MGDSQTRQPNRGFLPLITAENGATPARDTVLSRSGHSIAL